MRHFFILRQQKRLLPVRRIFEFGQIRYKIDYEINCLLISSIIDAYDYNFFIIYQQKINKSKDCFNPEWKMFFKAR